MKSLRLQREIDRSANRRARLVPTILLSLLLPFVAAKISYAQSNGSRLDAARELVAAKQFDQAIPILQSELKGSPENDDARILLARVYSWTQRYDESLTEYRRLLQKNPDNAAIRADYARVLAWSGRHEDAIAEYRRALKTDPANQETRLGYARALAWGGDLAGASIEYDRLLAQNPNLGDAWLGRASVARWRGAATASDRFLESAERFRADSEGVDGEHEAVRNALAPSLGGGWFASKEREYVAGPDFTLETEGPYGQGRATLGRSVGVNARVASLTQTESPAAGGVANYDLNSVDTRVGITLLRGYPWQAAFGVEYQTFESRGDSALYPLIGDDTFFGYNARLWRYLGRWTPHASAARSYVPMKDTLSTGLLAFEPGHVDNYEAGVAWQGSGRVSADGLVSRGNYSDDNSNWMVAGGAAYRVRTRFPSITFDGRATYRDWDFQSPDYFTPLNSFRGAAGVTFAGYVERPTIDYSYRYEFSGLSSSNFETIWVNTWSGNFNITAMRSVPLGVEASYSIDNNSYETWFVGLSAAVRW